MDIMVITKECLRFISINEQETNVVLFPSLEILNFEKLALVMENYLFYHDWAGQSQCSHRKHIKQGLDPACCNVGSGCCFLKDINILQRFLQVHLCRNTRVYVNLKE